MSSSSCSSTATTSLLPFSSFSMGKEKKKSAFHGEIRRQKNEAWDDVIADAGLLRPLGEGKSTSITAPEAESGKAGFSGAGSATLSLQGLFKLIQKGIRQDVPIRSYLLSKASYRFHAIKDYAKMQVRYEIRVLTADWQTIPLLSNKVALTSSKVTAVKDEKKAARAKEKEKEKEKEKDKKEDSKDYVSVPSSPLEDEGFSGLSPDEEVISCIGVFNCTHGLIVNAIGDYTVELEVLAPYTSTREMGLLLDIPEAAQTDLVFEIDKTNLEIKVNPSLSTVKTTDEKSGNTSITCQLPPSSSLSIQWTEKIVEVEKPQEETKEKLLPPPAPKPLTVTAEQNTLHSIGEGIVSSQAFLKYAILNGSVSLFDIEIDARVRILNVNGKGIKRWDIVDAPKVALERKASKSEPKADSKDGKVRVEDGGSGVGQDPTSPLLAGAPDSDSDPSVIVQQDFESKKPKGAAKSAEGAAKSVRILKVYLEYGAEENCNITVTSEMEMGSTSCVVNVPAFRCLGIVSREKGYVGIEARTNVEIQFINGGGCAAIDTTELPKQLWEASTQPIILAYKFLDPKLWIQVDVKKHADVNVLIAVVEEAHVVITQTTEGRILTKLVAQVRNTQQQFLRITMPEGSNVWSTVVSGRPVKPAQDNKEIMIPMQKSDASSNQSGKGGNSFRVEFVYFQETKKTMKGRGRLQFELPKLDLPVNDLFVSLYVPLNFRYGEFDGDMKEVPHFRKSPLSHISAATPVIDQAFRVPQMQTQMPARNMDYSSNMSYDRYGGLDDNVGEQAILTTSSYRPKAAAVLPVQIDIPTQGKLFYFEQLLVSSESKLQLRVDFKESARKGCCQRRRVGGCIIL